jgi:hypothetical protein
MADCEVHRMGDLALLLPQIAKKAKFIDQNDGVFLGVPMPQLLVNRPTVLRRPNRRTIGA